MSISDPLTLLREFTIAKKAITLEGDHIVFGRTRFPRGAATAYRAGSGKKDYYSIDSVWGLLEKGGDKAAEYAKWCGAQGITVIAFLDRKNLLSYLRGEGDGSSANVDYAGVPQVKPVDEAGASMDVAMADGAEAASLPSALKPSRKREPTAEEAKAIEEAKEAFKQVLVKPIGAPIPDKPAAADEPAATDGPSADVAMGEAADEGGSAEPVAGDKGGKKKAKAGEGKAAADPAAAAAKHSMDGLKEAIALAKPFIRSDRELSSAIVKRERQMRSRSSSLLAPHAKSFPVLTAILDGFKKRNKAVMDLKDREARKSSKSGGGPSSAAAASSAAASSRSAASSSIPPLPAHLAAPKPKPSASSSSVPRPAPKGGGATGGKSGVGILVVPAAITAIVNMYNARKLLENDEYTPGVTSRALSTPLAHTPRRLDRSTARGGHMTSLAATWLASLLSHAASSAPPSPLSLSLLLTP